MLYDLPISLLIYGLALLSDAFALHYAFSNALLLQDRVAFEAASELFPSTLLQSLQQVAGY